MSLRYAILGLLTFEPMSGYTLKTRYFDRSIRYFWPADQAQIYRTLQALEDDGAVTSETLESESRPNRKLYTISGKGGQELRDWLAQKNPPETQKDAFLVQLYFGRMLSKEQVLSVLQSRRAEHLRQLQHFETFQMPTGDTPAMRQQILFGGLTLDFARRRERMMLEWLDACLSQVSEWTW
jgi:PadR family transcriptional regulator AphA